MMNKNRIYEMPFEYLRRKEDGNKFSDEIVRNWYIARAFVLNQFKEMKVGFEPERTASKAAWTGIVYCLPSFTPSMRRIASECPWLTPLPQNV